MDGWVRMLQYIYFDATSDRFYAECPGLTQAFSLLDVLCELCTGRRLLKWLLLLQLQHGEPLQCDKSRDEKWVHCQVSVILYFDGVHL